MSATELRVLLAVAVLAAVFLLVGAILEAGLVGVAIVVGGFGLGAMFSQIVYDR